MAEFQLRSPQHLRKSPVMKAALANVRTKSTGCPCGSWKYGHHSHRMIERTEGVEAGSCWEEHGSKWWWKIQILQNRICWYFPGSLIQRIHHILNHLRGWDQQLMSARSGRGFPFFWTCFSPELPGNRRIFPDKPLRKDVRLEVRIKGDRINGSMTPIYKPCKSRL